MLGNARDWSRASNALSLTSPRRLTCLSGCKGSTDHTQAVASSKVTKRFRRVTMVLLIAEACPSGTSLTISHVGFFHTRMRLSSEHENTKPAWSREPMASTGPIWPLSTCMQLQAVSALQTRTVSSFEPEKRSLDAAEKARHSTESVWPRSVYLFRQTGGEPSAIAEPLEFPSHRSTLSSADPDAICAKAMPCQGRKESLQFPPEE